MRFNRTSRIGFSVVELLVVVATLALLITLLLPALRVVRQSAWTTGCSAKQRAIGIASLSYSLDYKGFFPLAYFARTDGPTQTTESLWPLTGKYETYMRINPTDLSWDGPFMCPAYTHDGILPRSTWHHRMVLNRSYSVARSLGQFRYNYLTPDASPWLRKPTNIRRLNNPAGTAWLADGTRQDLTRLNYAGDAEIFINGFNAFFGPMNRHAGGTNNILFADGHVELLAGNDLSDRVIGFWLHPQP